MKVQTTFHNVKEDKSVTLRGVFVKFDSLHDLLAFTGCEDVNEVMELLTENRLKHNIQSCLFDYQEVPQ